MISQPRDHITILTVVFAHIIYERNISAYLGSFYSAGDSDYDRCFCVCLIFFLTFYSCLPQPTDSAGLVFIRMRAKCQRIWRIAKPHLIQLKSTTELDKIEHVSVLWTKYVSPSFIQILMGNSSSNFRSTFFHKQLSSGGALWNAT